MRGYLIMHINVTSMQIKNLGNFIIRYLTLLLVQIARSLPVVEYAFILWSLVEHGHCPVTQVLYKEVQRSHNVYQPTPIHL